MDRTEKCSKSLGIYQAYPTYSGFFRDSWGKTWHLSKSVIPSEALYHGTLGNVCVLAAEMGKSVLES